jgi:hypothetical protein
MHAAQRQTSSIQTTKSSNRDCTTLHRQCEHCIVAIARYGGLTETQPRSHQKPSATPEAYSREIFHVGSTTSPFRAYARFYRIMHQQSDASLSTSKMHAPEIYDFIARRISACSSTKPAAKATPTPTPVATRALAPTPTAAKAPWLCLNE